jgi:hypothetical protein
MPEWLPLGQAADELVEAGLPPEVAQRALLTELAEARRRSEGIRRFRRPVTPPEFEPITQAFWILALADIHAEFDFEKSEVFSITSNVEYSHVRVSPIMIGDNIPPPVEQKSLNKGGRPPKFDWKEFLYEVIRIVDLDSLPEDPRELTKKMMDVVANWEDSPSQRSVRAEISTIYSRVKGR